MHRPCSRKNPTCLIVEIKKDEKKKALATRNLAIAPKQTSETKIFIDEKPELEYG